MIMKQSTTPGNRRPHRAAVFGGLLFILAACESPEQITARQEQFNGRSLEEVVAIIGPPTERTRSEAVWSFRETYVFHSPNTVLINNKLVTIGTTPHEGVRACTYRATLERGRVTASAYQGNGCARYAPRLRTHNQNSTVAARAVAERKTFGHLS
jgi:hypothetical protein